MGKSFSQRGAGKSWDSGSIKITRDTTSDPLSRLKKSKTKKTFAQEQIFSQKNNSIK